VAAGTKGAGSSKAVGSIVVDEAELEKRRQRAAKFGLPDPQAEVGDRQLMSSMVSV
jgi:hypothetical protein